MGSGMLCIRRRWIDNISYGCGFAVERDASPQTAQHDKRWSGMLRRRRLSMTKDARRLVMAWVRFGFAWGPYAAHTVADIAESLAAALVDAGVATREDAPALDGEQPALVDAGVATREDAPALDGEQPAPVDAGVATREDAPALDGEQPASRRRGR